MLCDSYLHCIFVYPETIYSKFTKLQSILMIFEWPKRLLYDFVDIHAPHIQLWRCHSPTKNPEYSELYPPCGSLCMNVYRYIYRVRKGSCHHTTCTQHISQSSYRTEISAQIRVYKYCLYVMLLGIKVGRGLSTLKYDARHMFERYILRAAHCSRT